MERIAPQGHSKCQETNWGRKVHVDRICGIDALHVINLMTEQHSDNKYDFLSNAMEPLLSAIFPDGRKPHSRPPSVHFDNGRVH
jgi:hypothetical protein